MNTTPPYKVALNYFVIPALVVAVNFFGNYFTMKGMDWYSTLKVPGITPPPWVFSVVWHYIYICVAISLIIVWNTFKRDKNFWFIISLFLSNAVVNVIWTDLFFSKHLLTASLIQLTVLLTTIVLLIKEIWPRNILAALLLFPYDIWVSFALVQLFLLWQIN